MSRGELSLYGDEFGAGALLGAYVVDRLAHRGVHATVYRAAHLESGRAAAVKVLATAFSTSSRMLRRFQQEAEALNRLRHPHIVEILEYGALRDGRPFIAMEWLDGLDLEGHLRERGSLSPREVTALARQVGQALAAAHAIGIVHRDLKLQNAVAVAPGEAPQVKLVDFGLAKLLGDERGTGLTSTGMVLGTPQTMAPEQIRGEPADARTDVYAFGVMLFHLLTGRPPFQGSNVVELEEAHLHAPPPAPRQLAPMPAALEAVVLRCLEKRAERRFGSVSDLLAAMSAAIEGVALPTRDEERMAALYAEARVTGESDDDALDDAEAAFELVRTACLEARLELVVSGAGALLAVAPLPADAEAERGARAGLRQLADTLERRLAKRSRQHPRVEVSVTLHVAAARTGEAQRPGDWAIRAPGVRVTAELSG